MISLFLVSASHKIDGLKKYLFDSHLLEYSLRRTLDILAKPDKQLRNIILNLLLNKMEKSYEKINGLRLTKCSDERYKPKHCIK